MRSRHFPALRFRVLRHRRGLPGEERFIHHEVGGLAQKSVCRHTVTFAQQSDVATHDLTPGDALQLAIAHHCGTRTRQLAQGRQRPFGAPLLQHSDRDDNDQ